MPRAVLFTSDYNNYLFYIPTRVRFRDFIFLIRVSFPARAPKRAQAKRRRRRRCFREIADSECVRGVDSDQMIFKREKISLTVLTLLIKPQRILK